jgi:hypothetical protein
MPMPSMEYFERLKDKLNGDSEYLGQARWLMGAILLQFGNQAITLYFHKGRIIEVEAGAAMTGTDFAVVGSEEAWDRLVGGELDFPRALSAGLRFEGNLVKVAGNMHALCLLFNQMSAIPKSEVAS